MAIVTILREKRLITITSIPVMKTNDTDLAITAV